MTISCKGCQIHDSRIEGETNTTKVVPTVHVLSLLGLGLILLVFNIQIQGAGYSPCIDFGLSLTYGESKETLEDKKNDDGDATDPTLHQLQVNNSDHCSVNYWLSEINKYETKPEDQILPDLNNDTDIGFLYVTYDINGRFDKRSEDRGRGKFDVDRNGEMDMSRKCLAKKMPQAQVHEAKLGDFSSYLDALIANHQYLGRTFYDDGINVGNQAEDRDSGESSSSSSSSKLPPFKGTFSIDSDMYAHPHSKMSMTALRRALKGVDMALVYTPVRKVVQKEGDYDLQNDGLVGGLIAQRHNVRTRLYHECVIQLLQEKGKGVRQQWAMNMALELPIASLVRVRWLPQEFHCWNQDFNTTRGWIYNEGPGVSKKQCFFMHSHNLLTKYNGMGRLCD